MADTVYNKVTVGNEVLIDLDSDTLSNANQIASGITAHLNTGAVVTGTLEPGGSIETEKSVTGTLTAQEITPSEGYDGMAKVTVSAVPQTESSTTHGTQLTIG